MIPKIRIGSRAQGFTLIELLLVIGIIAVLAVLAIASYRQVRLGAEHTRLLHNKEAVALALKLFYEHNGEWALPVHTTSDGDRVACLKPDDGEWCFSNPEKLYPDGAPGDSALVEQLSAFIKPLPLPFVSVKTGLEGFNVNSFVYVVNYSGTDWLDDTKVITPGVYLFWIWVDAIDPSECPSPSKILLADEETNVWICEQWVGPIAL